MGISIRKFLLVNLLLAMTIVISLTAVGNYYLDKQDIEDHLDNILSQAGLSFTAIASHDIRHQNWKRLQARMNAVPAEDKKYFQGHESVEGDGEKYRFQIWGPGHILLVRSSNAPTVMLSDGQQGFNDFYVDHIHYRVFTNSDRDTGLVFIVAEPYFERDRLAHHILADDLYIMLLTYPLAGFLIWVIIGRGLNSLGRVTRALRKRDPHYLEPFNVQAVPIEIQPLIIELNNLFYRLKEAFEREKRFASDAAHELRTPLAAIRTQAQVALMVASTPEQSVVLHNVVLGVDRATHIVNQLLSMSRLVPENEQMKDAVPCELELTVQDVIDQLKPMAETKKIALHFHKAHAHTVKILGNPAALQILVRNLVDNAIRYTPTSSKVDIAIHANQQHVILTVADNGPGVPKEFRDRIFERFFRMLGNASPGSGLGLSIVRQVADLHGAVVTVSPTDLVKDTGLTVKVQFSSYHAHH